VGATVVAALESSPPHAVRNAAMQTEMNRPVANRATRRIKG